MTHEEVVKHLYLVIDKSLEYCMKYPLECAGFSHAHVSKRTAELILGCTTVPTKFSFYGIDIEVIDHPWCDDHKIYITTFGNRGFIRIATTVNHDARLYIPFESTVEVKADIKLPRLDKDDE